VAARSLQQLESSALKLACKAQDGNTNLGTSSGQAGPVRELGDLAGGVCAMVQVISSVEHLINWIDEKTEPRRLQQVAGGHGGIKGCQVIMK